MTFYEQLAKWQPFFAAVAGATATLAGLLFVALSINREKVAAPENSELLWLAKRSFGDYLLALFLSLMCLVPAYQAYIFVIPLSCVLLFKVRRLFQAVFGRAKSAPGLPPRKQLTREYWLQFLVSAGLIFAIVEIARGEMVAIYIFVPVLSMLIYNATANAWLLLILENREGPRE